jgi:hypothetical protein
LPHDTVFKANFTISRAAREELARVRASWPERTGQPAGVTSIGWGVGRTRDGRVFEEMVMGFYAVADRSAIADHIQVVSGEELVFFITGADVGRFEGKTIHHTSEKLFHLV